MSGMDTDAELELLTAMNGDSNPADFPLEPVFGGGASTATPPAPIGQHDPGSVYAYGPHFVRFVIDRFAHAEMLMAQLLNWMSRRSVEGFRRYPTGNTTAAGACTIVLFESQPGQKYSAHRVYIHAAGYSWSAPFTASGAGSVELQVGGAAGGSIPWDGAPLTPSAIGQVTLPCVFTTGRLQGVEAQDGETLSMVMVGGPANCAITVRVQGVLGSIHDRDD